MGFLTSPLSERAQAVVQEGFQMGAQMAALNAQRREARQAAIEEAQRTEEARRQQFIESRKAMLEQRAYDANVRLQQAKDLDAREFHKNITGVAEKGLATGLTAALRPLTKIIDNPDVYDPSTVQSAVDAQKKIYSVYYKGTGEIAGLPIGQMPNIGKYAEEIASIPYPQIKYSQTYLDEQQSKTNANNAKTNKYGMSADKAPKWQEGWMDAIIGYRQALSQLNDDQVNTDAALRNAAQKTGEDLFAPQKKAVNDYKLQASQWGTAAAYQLGSEKSSLGNFYRHLRAKGLSPFDVNSTDAVGSELYNVYSNPSLSDEERAQVSNASYVFTGKDPSTFAPPAIMRPSTAVPRPW